jgi:16S rRNA C967 or C1407 C5-methylase (RsmB/RsmF family)/NOL1/NOP2/fmu family ribosome biogenesis protein
MSLCDEVLSPDERDAFEQSLNQYAFRSIRLRPGIDVAALPFVTEPVLWHAAGRLIPDSQIRPSQFLEFAAGDYYIQDAGSMLALEVLDARPGELICDLCAAPGAKASAILESLNGTGMLLANEVIRSRADVLAWSLARTRHSNYALGSLDPVVLADHLHGQFDAVLVDAPCSGQALVSNNKRDQNAFAAQQIEHSAQRQARILDSAIKLLKPGGRLVYSTCTFAVEENEQQMQRLIETSPESWQPILPDKLSPFQSPILAGCYRVWPHRDRCAGAFAAGYRFLDASLSAPSEEPRISSRKNRKRKSGKPKHQAKPFSEAIAAFGTWHSSDPSLHGERWYLQSDQWTAGINERMQIPGVTLPPILENAFDATPRPTWQLAMLAVPSTTGVFEPHQVCELTDDQATAYIRGEAIGTQSGRPGWQVALWHDRPLGWLKRVANRANNHLPKFARLNLH